ncbi:BTB/POZ domain-containing protein At3g49900 [Cicer arietinum]|uniref:BTB/POZ domain-containing protein At3g49900 n=1 Tax=Cicer arietinum TaxID=3827 RepID=A0A1S2YY98_CICAR|nr:BTB/POZ domain-containing protein At3g49900 [Cicer arietinum]
MKGWNQFGVIETIYEEEREFSSSSSPSPSLSPSFSSSPPSLHSTVNAWTIDSGCETDVLIRVEGTCFRLHKDRIIPRSLYLKRHLSGVFDFTLSPPLNITAETFNLVAEFCYGRKIQLSPINVAAVITASELLGMREGENLREVAESYFERIVCIDASTIMRSCLALFPDAETTASLASRCIEALIWENDNVDDSVLDVVVEMQPRDFQMVVYSLNGRLRNHDFLYNLVHLYLKENKYGKLAEEQKTEICNSIDCTKLSPRTLVDCVQNPIMPLRFIVRAILVEHLTTRRTITEAAATTTTTTSAGNVQQQLEVQRTSLREFLQRDSARRQTAQLKEAMNSTFSRIQTLEKELSGMKKILQDHEAEEEKEKAKERRDSVLNSERSASFHFVPIDNENSKIQRGGRGSVSSSGFVLDNMITNKNNEMVKYKYNVSSSQGSCHDGNVGTPKNTTSFRHRFITGLKNTFKISSTASN